MIAHSKGVRDLARRFFTCVLRHEQHRLSFDGAP
jgi:hypothetical protein